jgi:hypothetical protein
MGVEETSIELIHQLNYVHGFSFLSFSLDICLCVLVSPRLYFPLITRYYMAPPPPLLLTFSLSCYPTEARRRKRKRRELREWEPFKPLLCVPSWFDRLDCFDCPSHSSVHPFPFCLSCSCFLSFSLFLDSWVVPYTVSLSLLADH